MLRIIVTIALLAAACGSGVSQSLAQSVIGTPALGATSPLGIPGSTSSASPTGIPLGATEIDSAGLSPAPGTGTCTTGAAGTGAAGGMSTFDGGGLPSSGMSPGCSTMTTSSAAANASPTGSSADTAALAAPGEAAVPLGATELDVGGLSPLPGIAPPATSACIPGADLMAGATAIQPGTPGLAPGAAGASPTLSPSSC